MSSRLHRDIDLFQELLDQLFADFGMGEDPVHPHQCGRSFKGWAETFPEPKRSRMLADSEGDEPADAEGCGHRWEHDTSELHDEAYDNAHICPNCGKGPWRLKLVGPAA